MDFELTDEQRAVQETAERFAAERLAPGYKAREADGAIDRDLLREMGGLGLIAPDMPEALGGLDAGGLTCGIVSEGIARGDLNVCYAPLLGSLGGGILARHASPDVASEWVGKVCAGEALLAVALTEPRGGSDAANLQLRAERSGNGFVLNGEKTSISLAAQADGVVLFARTGGPGEGAHGVSAFFVDLSEPGVTRSSFDDLGSRAVGRGSIFFDNVHVPAECLLGDEGQGFRQVMQGFDYSRALIGLQCIGPAQASLDESWSYVTEREAFGRPLAQYQGVTFPLAEADTMLTAARLLCYKTLWLRDHDRPHTAEAAMCKWWAPKVAHDAIQQCLLTHGHSGYSTDLPHQQRMRDVFGLQIGDGTAQIMKLVIARERVGRIALQYA